MIAGERSRSLLTSNLCPLSLPSHSLFPPQRPTAKRAAHRANDAVTTMLKQDWRKLHAELAHMSDVPAVVDHLHRLGVEVRI